MRSLEIGQPVVFIDQHRNRVPALIQCVHGEPSEHEGHEYYPCVNLVFVSRDQNRSDSYGRQIEHQTSVSYWSSQRPVVGFCWYFPGEDVVIDEANIATQK